MNATAQMRQFFERHSFSITNRIRHHQNDDQDATIMGIVVDGKEIRFEFSASMRDSNVRPGDVTAFCRHHLYGSDDTPESEDGWVLKGDDFAARDVGGQFAFILDSDAISRFRADRNAQKEPTHWIAEVVSGEVRWSA